ncbi:MAG: hypothetical protein AB7O67_16220 [Vicinamibacterales bacterium]
MRLLSRSAALLSATLLVATAAPLNAQPGPRDDQIELTFDNPVQVPGATLPAGSYIFRLANSTASRQVIRVIDADTHKLYATTMAIPATRDVTNSDIVVTFATTREGLPPAIKSWFYPGQQIGHHFMYPPRQAMDIARTTKTLVLSSDVDQLDAQAMDVAPLNIYDWEGDKYSFDSRRLEYEPDHTPNVRAATNDAEPESGEINRPEAGEDGSMDRSARSTSESEGDLAAMRERDMHALDAADATGRTTGPSADVEDRAEAHLEQIVESANAALAMPGPVTGAEASTVTLTRSELREIRNHADAAQKLLSREADAGGPEVHHR